MSEARYRVRVLSSYIISDDDLAYAHMGRRNRWVNGFVSSLVRNRSGLREFDLQFHRTPADRAGVEALVEQWRREGVDLAICPGTDSALRLAEANDGLPMIYFGAHPENNGLELLDREEIVGVRLNLPLIWSHADNFALLRQIMPRLKRLYFALNMASEFAFPNVRVVYRTFRASGTGFWIPGDHPCLGYRSVAFLAEREGLQYYEGPYNHADELVAGLEQADLEDAALVGFNDTVLNQAATDRLLEFSDRRGVPLVWVNNPSVIERYGVADFSSDFEGVGRIVGTLALSILRDGISPGQLGLQADPGVRRTLNLARAQALGFGPYPEDLLARFHTVVR